VCGRARMRCSEPESPVDWPLPDRLTVNAVDRAAVPDVLLIRGALPGGNRPDS